MQFTEISFALFFGFFFCIYWFAFRNKLRCQNILLLGASYLFYGWWDWRFLLLIIITSFSTYASALLYVRQHKRVIISANIILNLGILVVFKYFNFFGENLSRLFELFGFGLDWFTLDVLLPVGISFYTFQAIGYSIDVMRGNIRPTNNIIGFFVFIAFFPQLVAGPIESAKNLLPQILRTREWNTPKAVNGLRMILFGLVKKLCVADMLAIYVDRIFDSPELGPTHILAGGIMFTFQLYCDFSAYSEIARGCASMLGINLMVNFRFPLLSRNIIEFWQRWHISLMLWFRDYLYIPLGGNRKGQLHTIINYSIVFLLSGLWHGASWNFVIWGGYWAICYVIGRYFLKLERKPNQKITFSDLPKILLTFGIVAFGFFIFRCPNTQLILWGLKSLWIYVFGFGLAWLFGVVVVSIWQCFRGHIHKTAIIISGLVIVIAATAIIGKSLFLLKLWWLMPAMTVALIEWSSRNYNYPFALVPRLRSQRLVLYWLMATFIILSEPTEMTFIYFQF